MKLKQFIFALVAMLSFSFSAFAQNEAKIGTTEYATLKQAVEAAAAGQEIVLLKNVTLQGGYDADPTAGLRIEKALTINGNKKTIDCGTFKDGIRVYITGSSKADVKFENVTIKNNNPYGRCIDMRTGKIALEVKSGAKLIAQGVNSQPLTIGGSSATYRVRVSNATIDAGETGYGIISFVRLTNNIEFSSGAKISGLAALYLKEGVTNTTVNMGNGTYTGTNLKSAESGVFGAVVIEGDNNTIVVNHEKSVVKAVAGDDVNQAVQAAFLVKEGATGNKIQVTNANAQVLTEGAQAQWAVVASDATNNVLINKGQTVNFAVECGGYLYMDANKAFSMVIPQEKEATTVKLLSDVTLDNTWTVAAGQDITLDLNGKTINVAYAEGSTTNHIYAIDNKGTLKITGNGTINARGIFNYGTMTLEDGTINAIDGNGGYAVRNYAGSLTMNGGTIATILEDDHQVDNGGYDATTVRVDEGATFTMNGGELKNICDYTFAIDNHGTTTVKGGKATSVHTTVANYGTINIEGGEFVCNGLEGITAHAVWAAEGTTNISGGTFNGKDNFNGFNVDASEGAVVNITGGTFLSVHSGSLYGNGTIAVSGGTFFDAVPAKYCATGFLPAKNADGTYGVQEGLVRIGETRFRTLQAAVEAAQAGDEIVVIADIADVTVDVTKNLTISGAATLKNVGINANGADALTVTGLTFTGNSWINSGTAEALTVSGVTATVKPSNTAYTNSRSAFISLGRSEGQELALTVENSNITVNTAGVDAILGWAKITKATITGNVIKGSSDGYFTNADAIKFMAIANGAEFEIKNNEIYSNYNGIVFAQNTTRDNAYSVSADANMFYGGADHIWIEITGGNTVHATVNATSANTVNRNAFTVNDIKYRSAVIKNWSSYAGVDVVTDANGKVIGGTLASFSNAESLADGYEIGEGGVVAKASVAEVNGTKYTSLADALAAAQAGSEIKLLANIEGDIIVPANVTLNGNGKQISGGILAEGDITFAGVTFAADFDAKFAGTAVNIPAGASLQLTGSARLVIGHGATFNITGTIADAKTADKATLTPSLKIAAGASITGNGVTFNVNNAYIVANANTTSKNSNANGTLDFNINNSIWEQTGVLAFYVPTSGKDPVVNFSLANSVLTTTGHLVFSVTKGEVVIDNSNVNVGTSRQIENRSTMTIKNGSVVNGAVATSSNAINPGTIIVENATYAVTGEFSGAAEGTGTLIIKKDANVSVGSIKAGANVKVDAEGMAAGDEINFTANLSQFTGTLSVINNDKLNAKVVNGKIVLVERTLAGEGTEASPYLINNIADLKIFRNKVNAGDNYSGKFVKLNADIDLNNEQWEPIGYMGKNFVGNFDGGNFTISNLKVTKELTNAAENNGVGLFGRLDSPATIKNLTIENATVTGSLYVGAVVGYAYTGKAIENVTVKGDIAINAYWYAGVIGGNGYMNLVNNCHVIGNNGSYIKGNNGSYIGGIWGFRGEGANKITNCTVTNLSIEGVDRVGGISGMAHYGNTISDCAVKNTAVKATDAKATTVGLIAGACQGTTDEPSIITGSTVENVKVTVADSEVVASLYGTNINGTTPVTNYVAKIGANYYESFEAAITAAQAGQTVSILKAGTYALKVKDGITITGAVAGVEFANIGAFGCNGANVTFNNVTFTYAENSTYKGLQHSGNLVYNNCTFNGQVFLYGLKETFNKCTFNTTDSNNYNVWTYGAKEVAFNECTFNSAGKSVLIYSESASNTNNVTVTKSQFNATQAVDGKAAIEMDSSLSGAVSLTIDGETTASGFAAGNVSGNSLWNNKKGNSTDANNDITVVVNGETVLAPLTFVAKIGDNGYTALADAFAAVNNNETITLATDLAIDSETYTIADGKNVTLDLNGKQITVTDKKTSNYELFYIYGGMTVTGNGTIELTATNDRDWNASSSIFHNRGGVLTIANGTFEHLGGTDMAYVVDNSGNWYGDATTNINGGELSSTYIAIRNRMEQNSHGASGKAILNVTAGTVSGTSRAIWAQAASTSETAPATGEINISGGTINGLIDTPRSTGAQSMTTISGGTVAAFKGEAGELKVTGEGNITGDITIMTAAGEQLEYMVVNGLYVGKTSAEASGTWGGIDWTLTYEGTLIIAPTKGTPGTDNSGKWSYEVGQWPEAVKYNNKGVGVDVGLWPYDRTKVKTLIIEEGVTSIGSFTAQGFTNLTGEVVIPYTVKYIGQEAFMKSTMTELTFAPVPEGKTGEELCIAQGALKNLVIEEITFPEDRPVHLHAWLIANCANLKHITLPATIKSINGTTHVDYNHNPNQTTGGGANTSAIISACPLLEDITFGSQEVRDLYYNPGWTRIDAPMVVNVGLKSYRDFRAGIDAAKDGETVLLLGNVTLEDTWTIPAGMNLTLNLNGKTISQEKACTASYAMINNKGNLNIVGSGKISFKDTSAGDPSFGWGSYTVRNEGDLVVEKATIEHLGEQTFATHCIMALYQYCGSTTINGGKISTPNYRSARLWKGEMTINGGTFDGQVWVQADDESAKLTINGGTFAPSAKGDASSVFVENKTYDVQLAVTNGTFNGKVGCSDATKLAGVITGGKFNEAAKNGTNANLLANGLVFADEAGENGLYSLVDGLKGAGTAEVPYMITSVKELEIFRDKVNSGDTKYNAPGVWVALGADIDLAGAEWNVGIGDGHNYSFDGNFDGKKHTIKNLNIKPYADESGYLCGGLFGYIYGAVTIKDLVIENATVEYTGEGESHNVGVLAGFAYKCNGAVINNVTVQGNIKVNAPNTYGVGAIVGYTHTNAPVITNCKVLANNDSYIKGHRFVGGIAGYSYTGATIKECTVKNIAITATDRGAAGIAGCALAGEITKCTVENVTLNATANVAYVVGELGGNVVNVAEHTAPQPWVGGSWSTGEAFIATIGNKYYTSIAAAIEAAKETDVITLIADITATESIAIPAAKKVTLDLNGKTITGTDNGTASYGLININPDAELTINDAIGNGAIKLTATNNRGWNAYSSVISNQRGKLTVNGGTIEHLGGTDMAYAIDNLTNTGAQKAETVINGGVIKSTYRAIRQFLNSTSAENILTVNGGTIEGTNKSIWMQNANANANPGALTVAEDAAIKGNVYVSGSGAAEFPVEISVANAALKDGATVLPSNVHESFAIANNNGVWGIIPSVASANGVGYASLLEAVNAAKTGETVTLFTDIALDTKILATQNDGYAAIINVADKAVTLDLNGKNITVDAAAADLANASGKMLLAVFSADLGGHLTLTDNSDAKNGAVTLNVNDAKVYSMFVSESKESDKSNSGKLTVNGGNYTTVGKVSNAMFFTDANEVITVNGGNFHCDGATTTASYPWMFNTNGNNELHVTVNGGTFNVDVNHQHRPFEVKVPETLAVKANDNGTWTVVEAEAYITEMLGGTVNEAGEWGHKVGYATIAEAIAAVEDGQTITLVKDITYTKENGSISGEYVDGFVYTGDKSFTLDFAGKTITENGDINDYLVYLKNTGAKDNEITFKNGTIAVNSESRNTAWAAITVGASSATHNTVLNLDGMKVVNGNPNDAANQVIRSRNGAVVNLNEGTVVTSNGTSYGVIAENTGTVNINDGAKVVHTNSKTTGGNQVYTAVSGNGTINVYDGAVIVSDNYGIHNMTTGNAVINIYGGTIEAVVAVKASTNGGADQSATVTIEGGNFKGALENYTNAATIVVKGGTFDAAVDTKYVATGYICRDNGDGTFGVIVDPKHGMVAQIIRNDYYAENQYFATINEAVQAAVTGETVTLIADVETSAAKLATIGDENYAVLVAVENKEITLNLNGKSVTVTPTAEELANAQGKMLMSVFGMDTNGKLTLTGNGSVKVNAKANRANVYSLVAAYGEGSAVVIENGSYEADSVNASGSLIYSHEMITVMDGTFKLGNIATGANGSPWIFNTIGQNYTGVKVVGGTYPTDINHQFWANEVLVPEAYALKNNGDGTWTVVDAVAYTNEKATSRGASWRHVGYASLEDAIAATRKYNCQNNTVTIRKDITLEPITVANGVKVAIDLNGKTISATDNATGSYALITNKGDLTINGTGAITLTATQNRGWSAYSSVISNTVGGKLTVNGGTIQHLGGTSMAYAIDNLTNGKGTYAETEINGGEIKSTYRPIRMFLNGVEADNILTVNAGTIESTGGNKAAIWMQTAGDYAHSGTLYVGAGAVIKNNVYLDADNLKNVREYPVEAYIAKAALAEGMTVLADAIPAETAALVQYDTFWQVEQKNLAELTIEDDCEEYINKIEKNVGVLTYERYFDDTEWQTIVLPFDVPVANLMDQFEVAYIYNASYKGKQATIDYVVIEDSEFVLAANYPYMIKAKATGWNDIVVENAKLMPTEAEILDCSSIFEKFSFIGNYATVDADNLDADMGYFNLTSGTWSKMDVVNPFRFYMQIKLRNGAAFEYPTDTQAIRMRSVNANGEETTGINGVDAEQAGDFIFDLHGRRVLETEKGGIYIKNGQKFIAQ